MTPTPTMETLEANIQCLRTQIHSFQMALETVEYLREAIQREKVLREIICRQDEALSRQKEIITSLEQKINNMEETL